MWAILLILLGLALLFLANIDTVRNPPPGLLGAGGPFSLVTQASPYGIVDGFTSMTGDATAANPTGSPTMDVPAASDGSTSGPSDAGLTPENTKMIESLLNSVMLKPANEVKKTPEGSTGTQSGPASLGKTECEDCEAKVASSVQPYKEALGELKQRHAALEAKHKEPTQRCPNMRDYIRKDSIPCYNCTI